jgi:hypothetical protein
MGFIYRVEIAGELYVGSTKVRLLCNRQKQHNYNLRTPTRKGYNSPLYIFCREHNVKKIICELIETVDNENIKIKEQEYIDLLQPSLNTYRAFRTEEQRIEENKEYMKEYNKKYYKNCKKKIY